MIHRIVMASLAIALVAASPGFNLKGAPPAKSDPLPALLEKLREPIDIHNAEGQISLRDLADFTSSRLGVPVKFSPEVATNLDDANAIFKTSPGKVSMRKTLTATLAQQDFTFLVRRDHLEIVTIETAARETRCPMEDRPPTSRLKQPLITAVIKETPLNEAMAEIAEEYDLTIVVGPHAGDAKASFVNARLLNVPLEKALDLLTMQAGLRAERRGNAFYITSADHSNDLFNEKIEREKQKAELEGIKLKATVPPVAAPEEKKEAEKME